MGRKIVLIIACLAAASSAAADEDRIGVLYSKFTTFVFPEDIVDVEAGSGQYHIKIKGKYLLLRAKHKKVAPTSLFVRYGKQKKCYVKEIFPDHQASLKYYIAETVVSDEEGAAKTRDEAATDAIFVGNEQEYCTIGARRRGVEVILTNILHVDQVTYLRFFIKNTASIPYSVTYHSFEYVTFLNRFFFFRKEKRKQVEPVSTPPSIHLPAKHGAYFVFAIPCYASEGGLEVLFGESEGERLFRLFIPSHILLSAERR